MTANREQKNAEVLLGHHRYDKCFYNLHYKDKMYIYVGLL